MIKKTINRRDFIRKSVATTSAAVLATSSFGQIYPGSVLGANDRINMGFIGVGNRGSLLMHLFQKENICHVAGISDVYKPYRDRIYSHVDPKIIEQIHRSVPKMGELLGTIMRCNDYRKLLDSKDIDAICIATPDHWHAKMTIDAIHAGKDVYCEKPLTATIHEGRAMVNAQKASKQVVAVGLNRRGNAVYQKLSKEIPAGKIGKVTVGSAFRSSNLYPNGVGKMKPSDPPKGFDWNTWIGPRAYRPYQYNMAPYSFRWFSDFSSQMGNWGVHFMDVIRWMIGETAPIAISAHGGQYVLDHDGDIPDTMQVIFEYPSGVIVNFSIYEATSGSFFDFGEVSLQGTKGVLFADEKGYKIRPTKAGQFQTWKKPLIESEDYTWKNVTDLGDGSNSNSTQVLVRDFLSCIKNRKTPLCPLEEGHRSTSLAHLANIALKMQRRLEWDAVAERFTNCDEANNLLEYKYRDPWKLNG